jgi:transcriptional regulator GlxA family with amidase domain
MNLSRRIAEMRFRRSTGSTIISEIINMRIDHVKILLLQRNISLEAIADRCGWKSLSSLCRCFRKKTGVTLSAFRRSNT